MRCAGLKDQEQLRDLSRLNQFADELVWLSQADLVREPALLVLCGLWLAEAKEKAQELLLKRSEAGLATLLVPRFTAGNISELLHTPTDLEIRPADFQEVTWEDGISYRVPGVSVLRTSLHSGKWGTALGVGPVVQAYKPHASAGPVVLCLAAVTGRPPGVSLQDQRRLFQRIVEKAASVCPASTADSERGGRDPCRLPPQPSASLAEFLQENREVGATLLLTLIAGKGDRSADLPRIAQDLLSIDLPKASVDELLPLVPEVSVADAVERLKEFGWGAYVRLLQEKLEMGEKT